MGGYCQRSNSSSSKYTSESSGNEGDNLDAFNIEFNFVSGSGLEEERHQFANIVNRQI